jgi:hypothetical protein
VGAALCRAKEEGGPGEWRTGLKARLARAVEEGSGHGTAQSRAARQRGSRRAGGPWLAVHEGRGWYVARGGVVAEGP